MPNSQTEHSAENHFRKAWDAGFRRVVPVIPPGVEVSERSILTKRMAAGDDPRGKCPGVRGRDGWAGIDFVKVEAEEGDLGRWARMGASVGIKTGRGLIALDIDTTDDMAAAELRALAKERLGDAPVRFGRAPKALLLYRVEGEPAYDKVTFSTGTEDHALVEVLTEGRQFVAQGIHPKTGRPYEWPAGLPKYEDIPVITEEALKGYMSEVEARMPASQRVSLSRADRASIDQSNLQAPLHLVEEALQAIPNSSVDFPSRDDYLKVGYALKAACGPDNEDVALDLYLDWCERWRDGHNDPDVAAADFARMKPPYSVGADWLFDHAERLGGWTGRARDLFGESTAKAQNDWIPGEGLQALPADLDLSIFAPVPDAEAPAKTSKLRFLSIDEIMELPDPEFLIDRHLPNKSFGLIFGEPGTKKSFLALDMAMHIALGRDNWHGDPIRKKDRGYVLYIAGEGVSGFKARITAWLEVNGQEGDDLSRFRLLPTAIDFMKPEAIKMLVDEIKAAQIGPLDLVIVDTVSRAIPGADENSAQDMSIFVKACDTVKEVFHTVVLGVHHSNKAGGMRGSSAILGACDYVFNVENSKGSHVVKLICAKQKDAPDAWADSYRMHEVQGSLVPIRMAEEPRPAGTGDMTAAEVSDVVAVIDRRWILGEPLSGTRRAKARFAGTVIALEAGMAEERVSAVLDLLKGCGAIVEGLHPGSGTHGLRVIHDAADILIEQRSEADEAAAEEELQRARDIFH